MPELPEVETLKNALLPLVRNKTLLDLRFFRKDIRFTIPEQVLRQELLNKPILNITRRGKYLLFHSSSGAMLWHLGMSGRVIQYPSPDKVDKHTHAIFKFEPETFLHFIDPRRFGCIMWASMDEGHPLINHLGPDPLGPEATPGFMKEQARQCRAPIKSFIMDSKRITGVGNIYACESLFSAGINPKRQAGKLTLPDWEKLLAGLRQTLNKSIQSGGTTLRDFFNPDGSAGYYSIQLSVYGKVGQPCPTCKRKISRITQSGRSTFYCKTCQKR